MSRRAGSPDPPGQTWCSWPRLGEGPRCRCRDRCGRTAPERRQRPRRPSGPARSPTGRGGRTSPGCSRRQAPDGAERPAGGRRWGWRTRAPGPGPGDGAWFFPHSGPACAAPGGRAGDAPPPRPERAGGSRPAGLAGPGGRAASRDALSGGPEAQNRGSGHSSAGS